MDKDINELRNEINSIDREFVELFIKRMGVSLSVAEYKKKPVCRCLIVLVSGSF